MNNKVVIIGLGEMGGVFARGFLRIGVPVFPVIRSMNVNEAYAAEPNPDMVLLAVAEKDLEATLSSVPQQWREKVALLQNELLPRDWERYSYQAPTVISVWFEKKKGQDVKVIIPSPVFGEGAELIQRALGSIDIPATVLKTPAELEYELVLKNVYILTVNIAGMVCGGSVENLWENYNELARSVANDVMDLQEWLVGKSMDREKLIQGFLVAIKGDPEHQCMGRSAPARLKRAIQLADEAGLSVQKLREIEATQ